MSDWGRGDWRSQGTASGAEELVLVPGPEESVCECLEVEDKMKEGLRDEQEQAQVGINKLCWTQFQLDNFNNSLQF